MIAEPSSKPGVKETTSTPGSTLPSGAADTSVGGSGTVAGVTGVDAPPAGPVPTPLVAVTVNV
jgi:hypothetical protein